MVRQLSPSPRVCHRPLVEHASREVHRQRDQQYQRENTPGAHASRLVRLGARARMLRAHLKEVGTFVGIGTHEVHRGVYVYRVMVAEEGDGGRLAPRRILVRVARRAYHFHVVIVIVFVIFIVFVFVGSVAGYRAAGGCAAGGAVGVL